MSVKIHESWKEALSDEFDQAYFLALTSFVRKEYQETTVYPPSKDIFRAFDLCPFNEVKVVVLGQDPYHGLGQANGLCFSVHNGVRIPPSLQNIYKELSNDLNIPIPQSGELERWAEQGVLLLNATLTVRARQAGSHQHKGWEEFTDAAVRALSEKREGLVFMLWGNYAKQKGTVIDRTKHFVLEAAHPSPFSAHNGFFGCKHFSKANEYLKERGKDLIEWG